MAHLDGGYAGKDPAAMRVVVVHDYLTQRGGAERVVLAFMRMYPHARLLTSFYNTDTTFPEFRSLEIEQLAPRYMRASIRDPRQALPFLPKIFGSYNVRHADIVICSTSGWAHGISAACPKIAYCYTPARWLYVPEDYVEDLGPFSRGALGLLRPRLLRWDQSRARTVSRYVAISRVVGARIQSAYGLESDLVAPPVSLARDGELEPLVGLEPGFFLTVARSRGYKQVRDVATAARIAGCRLVVVGRVERAARIDYPFIRYVGTVTDGQLRWLYGNACAVVSAAREDFGLTVVEGYRFGAPALALRAGGFLDTVEDGVTGRFFDSSHPAVIADAMTSFDLPRDLGILQRHAKRYSEERFHSEISCIVSGVMASHN